MLFFARENAIIKIGKFMCDLSKKKHLIKNTSALKTIYRSYFSKKKRKRNTHTQTHNLFLNVQSL